MKIDANAPAFPMPIAATIDNALVCAADVPGYHALSGLTIRAEIASRVLAGIKANSITGDHHQPQIAVREAVELADALIAQLNRE